jgi:hypothetical protein
VGVTVAAVGMEVQSEILEHCLGYLAAV